MSPLLQVPLRPPLGGARAARCRARGQGGGGIDARRRRGSDSHMYNCMGGESTRGDDAESMSPPPEPSLAISNGSLDTYPVATHIRSARRCAATASPPWAAAWRVLRVGRTRRATETETPPPRGPRAAEPPTARRRRRRPRRSLLRRSPSISTSSRRAMSCYITIYHGLISTSARRAMPCYITTHHDLISTSSRHRVVSRRPSRPGFVVTPVPPRPRSDKEGGAWRRWAREPVAFPELVPE